MSLNTNKTKKQDKYSSGKTFFNLINLKILN